MSAIFFGIFCLAGLALAFTLGWRWGMRRQRKQQIKAAWDYTKKIPYKVQGQYSPKKTLPAPPSIYLQLDVVKDGVIALHNAWRKKWHGLP